MIRFKLLDIGSLPVQGDVSSALLMAPNSQVYKDLEKGINSGTFSFDIQLPAGSEKVLVTKFFVEGKKKKNGYIKMEENILFSWFTFFLLPFFF